MKVLIRKRDGVEFPFSDVLLATDKFTEIERLDEQDSNDESSDATEKLKEEISAPKLKKRTMR